jgi:SAM-dependent methyltransferase
MLRLLNMILGRRAGFDARDYWERRYRRGGTSGAGSEGALAAYKARVVNDFVAERGIRSVIEFGCGDGRQLALMEYPRTLGLDVAPAAVEACRERFREDASKRFEVYVPGALPEPLSAELVVALDVVYHIVDDAELERTLDDIFRCAERHVILFANVAPRRSGPSLHVRYRDTLRQLARFEDFEVEAIVARERRLPTHAQFIVLARKGAA